MALPQECPQKTPPSSEVRENVRDDGPEVVSGLGGEGVEVGVGVALGQVRQRTQPEERHAERAAHLRWGKWSRWGQL